MTEAESIQQILARCRSVDVVGLSPKPHRASHEVARYMQAQGWRIIPVNPNAREVLGEKAYASLTQAAAHETIDLVNVFRHSEEIPPIADEAIASGAKALWLQLGIENDDALARAAGAGLLVVQNRCLKVEHASARR
jgi:predicted CoA-binding protein